MLMHINVLVARTKHFLKNNASLVIKIGICSILCAMVITTSLLMFQYYYFKQETSKMMEVKEDYRNYVLAVKKILKDYHKNKERLEELETFIEEKKNDIEDEPVVAQSDFPDGVRVYSSDDDNEDSEGSSFVLINRELEYLKQGAHDYLKKQKQFNVMNALGSNIWLDYTEQVEQEHQKAEAQKKRRTLARKKRYASRRKPKNIGALQESGAVAQSEVNDIALIWPIDRSSFWLSSFFGPRKHNGRWGFHRGIDMAAVKGTPVKAVAGGVVVEARYAQGYGKTVVIAHNAKYKTRYAHLNNILVKVGQKVETGDYIGRVGATGFVRSKRGGDASHLHFEVYVYGKQVNPMYFLG